MSLLKRYESSSGRRSPLIAIEHLEDELGKWILLEYKHALEITSGRLAITNAGTSCNTIVQVLGRVECYSESILKLRGVLYNDPRKVIILDPQAEKTLEPSEAREAEAIVVGGILGDHPPRGRTWKLLTRYAVQAGMKPRNIGSKQFSIDGAVYVALQITRGKRLEDIDVIESPRIEVEREDGVIHEIVLPFAYPKVDSRPLLAPGLRDLLLGGLSYEEYMLMKKSKQNREQGL